MVIGGVAGGIAALLLFAFLATFLLRRLRSRRENEEFDASDFRRSAVIVDDEKSDFFGAPPNMANRSHGVAPSISGSMQDNIAGMGSRGAYDYSQHQTEQQHQQQPADGYTTMERETYADGSSQGHGGSSQGHGGGSSQGHGIPGQIKEREKYTFGEIPSQSAINDQYAQDAQSHYQYYAEQANAQYDEKPQHHQPARPSVGDVSPYGGI
jgi:hypothetical protein